MASSSSTTSPVSGRVLGFLGCGKISSALCRGFASHTDVNQRPLKILVSERSREKSAALAEEFPDLVQVCVDNAQIVSEADVIFIGLLPGVAKELLPTLPFRPEHLVISMMAAVNYNTTLTYLPSIPASRVVRTVPLPSAASRSGPILQFPPHEEAAALLRVIGTPVICISEDQMVPMIAVTGHISSLYELMRSTESFVSSKGVEDDTARTFVKAFYSSLAQGAERSHDTLAELRDEAATPGGLNEQSVKFLRSSPHFDLQTEVSIGLFFSFH